jgi:hypothetical protein
MPLPQKEKRSCWSSIGLLMLVVFIIAGIVSIVLGQIGGGNSPKDPQRPSHSASTHK